MALIAVSGLISGSETAFFSFAPADLETLRSGKHVKDKEILKLRDNPKYLLATILISNNFVNVAIVMLSAYFASLIFNLTVFPVLAFIVQVVVITSVILLFGEITPKIMANNQPVRIARLMVRPLKFLMVLSKPLSTLLVKSTSLIDKKLISKKHEISMSDISDAIDLTVDESAPEEEKMMLKSIATFGEIEVSEIMQSRVNVTAVSIELSFEEVMKIVKESGFSRIPVYEETFDNIVGVLYIKDLLPYIEKPDKVDWKSLIRPAFFIPENKKINDLLQEFRQRKIHLAIVVDEYGGTSGIITLEDIIEEIVGEISDEFDKSEKQYEYRKVAKNTFIFEAKTLLNDLCKVLEVDDDYFDEAKGVADSLGGLILEMLEKIPEKDTKLTYKDIEFTIVDVDKWKINKVKVKLNKKNAGSQNTSKKNK
ncbi:MAG: gliding motility-associated protein GldE [Chlorobi bacterium]|nr:gliding motility-associated protein GldE [Chlorobiota bacterium]